MGWAGGSAVAEKILDAFYELIDGIDEDLISSCDREDFIFSLFDAFRDVDCDTLCELEGYSEDVDNILHDIFGDDDE